MNPDVSCSEPMTLSIKKVRRLLRKNIHHLSVWMTADEFNTTKRHFITHNNVLVEDLQ